jgi:hypothetical protein
MGMATPATSDPPGETLASFGVRLARRCAGPCLCCDTSDPSKPGYIATAPNGPTHIGRESQGRESQKSEGKANNAPPLSLNAPPLPVVHEHYPGPDSRPGPLPPGPLPPLGPPPPGPLPHSENEANARLCEALFGRQDPHSRPVRNLPRAITNPHVGEAPPGREDPHTHAPPATAVRRPVRASCPRRRSRLAWS